MSVKKRNDIVSNKKPAAKIRLDTVGSAFVFVVTDLSSQLNEYLKELKTISSKGEMRKDG